MEEKKQVLNIVVNLEKDLESEEDAIIFAQNYLQERGFAPREVTGWIYLNGRTISDLLIVTYIEKSKRPKVVPLRSCTKEEWNKFFYDYLSADEEIKNAEKFKLSDIKK